MDSRIAFWLVILSVLFQVKCVESSPEDVIKDSTLHLRMKRSDLERYFGVSSHDQVPEYELTHPFQADEDGKFVSHTLDSHARQKRGIDEPNAWYYSVKAFGMSLHLNLSKNEGLMSPGMKVEKHENGTVTQEDAPQNSFYRGHVTSEPGSLVALSNANGLTGIIRFLDQSIFVQPLDRHIASDSSAGHPHLIYKRSVDQALAEDLAEDQALAEDLAEDLAQEDPAAKKKKKKKKPEAREDGNKYLEMTLVADKYTIAFHKEKTTQFLLMLANVVNTMYHDESFGEKKITIVLVGIKLVNDGLVYTPNFSNQNKLATLRTWAKLPASKVPKSDVVGLISRGGTGGLATYNEMCKSSAFVSNEMGLPSVIIIAHEAGHTLGLGHDGGKCPNMRNIMATTVASGGSAMKWSPCSRETIQKFLSSEKSECLNNKPRSNNKLNYMKYFTKGSPGAVMFGDEQCKLQYGDKYSQCKQKKSDCGSLYCTSDGYSCVSKVAPPMEGTSCGIRHHCLVGACVDNGAEIINGGWSPWGPYKKCSRSCDGGIQFRARTCTKPRPQNGGDDCAGESKAFLRVCGSKPCPRDDSDRTGQCKKHGAHLIEFYRGDAPCSLYCRAGNSYSPKGLVQDGTRCYKDPTKKDLCYEGKCLVVGCDNVIGSTAVHDRCGVCNGDSTKCMKVANTYTKDWQEYGTDKANLMFVAPKGSRQIYVYNMGTGRNSIGVQSSKKEYLIDLPSRKQTVSAAGSEIKYSKPKGRNGMLYVAGPITQSLRFMYVYLEPKMGVTNKGIKYQFFRPGKSVITSNDVAWEEQGSEWSECSATCGGGTKTRVVRCKRIDDKTIVADKACASGSKPDTEEKCNPQACPKEWHLTGWSHCSKTCGPGMRTREVSCRQLVQIPGEYKTVSGCPGPKPTELTKKCYRMKCPAEWVPSDWTECSKTCGGGGFTTRTLSCKRLSHSGQFTPVPSTLCAKAVKPPVKEQCNEDLACPAKKRSYRSLGCYKENLSNRLLPHLVRNLRSNIDWKNMHKTVAACFNTVKDSKYGVFGVKFYGECWAGQRPESEFRAKRSDCFQDLVGKGHTYYVYEIE